MSRGVFELLSRGLLALLFVGCGGSPGVSVPTPTGINPPVVTKSGVVKDYTARLDADKNKKRRLRYVKYLGNAGGEAEASIPALEKVVAGDDNEDIRKAAQESIEKIKAAIAAK